MSDAFTEDQIDAGRRLFGGPSRFLLGVAKLEQLPPSKGVEIAFAGRSNVGKSSLIKACLNQYARQGLRLIDILVLTRSLGERLADDPETFDIIQQNKILRHGRTPEIRLYGRVTAASP